jgi:hypothetical protein
MKKVRVAHLLHYFSLSLDEESIQTECEGIVIAYCYCYGRLIVAGGNRSMNVQAAKRKVQQEAGIVTHNPLIEGLARAGYVARGLLYIVVGILAVQVALGLGGATTDKKGAIEVIGGQPFGKFLLVLVAIGLAGYSLWGLVRAIFDPLKRGTDAKGIAQRIGYLVSAVAYGSLVLPTVAYIQGASQSGSSQGSQDLTAKLLSLPFGQGLAVIVGLIGMVGGIGQIWQGISTDFKKDLKTGEMSANEITWAIRVGRFGSIARGVIFMLLGFFVVQAALHYDPKQAQGLDGALRTVAAQPYGPWLLCLVALGLISFGIYSVLCARWMKLTKSASDRH